MVVCLTVMHCEGRANPVARNFRHYLWSPFFLFYFILYFIFVNSFSSGWLEVSV